MRTRAFYWLGIAMVSVFIGYAMGCNGLGVIAPPSASLSGFVVSNLSIQPIRSQPNEAVTITVSVANTHDTWGAYSLVLNINSVKEAEKQAELDAGSTQNVSFSVTRGKPGSYTVFINGLVGSFDVVAPVPP